MVSRGFIRTGTYTVNRHVIGNVPFVGVSDMAYKEIYQRYFSKLIKCLPMDDGLFLAMLSEHELLPGDTEGKVKSLATQTEKATYFISHVIKPSLDVDSRVYLNKLLLVMSESGYKHVEEISSRIKSEIANTENSKTSMLCMLLNVS